MKENLTDPLASIVEAEARRKLAADITRYARAKGLDVTEARVLRHFTWFARWYHGGLATGYLMRRLGIRRIGRQERDGS